MVDMRHVHADLVRAPGFQLQFQQAVMGETCAAPESALSPACRVLPDRHLLALHRMPTDAGFDAAAGGDDSTGDRDVFALLTRRACNSSTRK